MIDVNTNQDISVTKLEHEEGFRIFTLSVSQEDQKSEYIIYISDKDLPLKGNNFTPVKLNEVAILQMKLWLEDSDNKFPKDKYRVLVNGGKITTSDISSFLSVQKNTSDLVRTNVTISAPLFEWAKLKAQNEDTSFSDLVSRGLLSLKDSDKEIYTWYKRQRSYFMQKLGDLGSFEVFHYLPNNYKEFSTDILKNSLQQSEINRTGWPIGAYLTGGDQRPHPQPDGIKAEYNNVILDYWFSKNKGEFYFGRVLESDNGNGSAEPKTVLYFDTLIWRVAESLEHCVSYYQNLDIHDEDRIKIKISLDGLHGRTLSAWNQMRSFTLRHYKCDSDNATWEIETNLKELKSNIDDIIYDSVKKLLIMFDFFVPNKEVVSDITNKEYRQSRS